MRASVLAFAATASLSFAVAAEAAIVLPGSSGVTPDDFALIAPTQGTELDTATISGTVGTFGAIIRAAVYRNALGTLDFYYQVSRTGPGTGGSDLIKTLTASIFGNFTTDVYRSIPDPDGPGFFLANSRPSIVPLTTIGRTANAQVLTITFALPGQNGIAGTDTTSTYVFRTNAVRYGIGFASVQDGTSLSGTAFAPLAVPEPQTWALLAIGAAILGFALRHRARHEGIRRALA
jgi:hypothetical protein